MYPCSNEVLYVKGHSWLESAQASWDLQYGYITYVPLREVPNTTFQSAWPYCPW